MNLEQVENILRMNGFQVVDRRPLSNGTQLRLESGQIVNVFSTGTVNVQGKNQDALRDLLSVDRTGPVIASRRVFVVYGHDQTARDQLEAMLRRWGLDPLFLDHLPSEGQTIIEKLEKYQSDATFAVVLATPDDEGHRAGHPDEKSFRARQNVVLELGMLLAMLGRSRVAVLIKDAASMERPSDIQGLVYIPFRDHVQETAIALAKEMSVQGINIELRDLA